MTLCPHRYGMGRNIEMRTFMVGTDWVVMRQRRIPVPVLTSRVLMKIAMSGVNDDKRRTDVYSSIDYDNGCGI